MASVAWDTREFNAALKQRLNRLEKSADEIPERMTSDMAAQAHRTVARRTGQTAAGIGSKKTGKGSAELTAPNPYLEFGTSRMAAQPFVRPARNEAIEKFRSGGYRPDL